MPEDIHAGMGGSYVINDAGEKVLVHRTDYVPESTAPAQKISKAPAASKQVSVKPSEGDK